MRFVSLAVFAVLLFGCVNTHEISSQIQGKEGVTIVDDAQGNKILESFEVKGDSKRDADVGLCIIQNVENEGVTLKGSASGYVGPYTGKYYSAKSSKNVDGGEIISYMSKDRNTIAANGKTQYFDDLVSNYSVKYLLTATLSDDTINLLYKPIEQTTTDSGFLENTGYHKVGAWEQANPGKVLDSLNKVSKDIIACLNQ